MWKCFFACHRQNVSSPETNSIPLFRLDRVIFSANILSAERVSKWFPPSETVPLFLLQCCSNGSFLVGLKHVKTLWKSLSSFHFFCQSFSTCCIFFCYFFPLSIRFFGFHRVHRFFCFVLSGHQFLPVQLWKSRPSLGHGRLELQVVRQGRRGHLDRWRKHRWNCNRQRTDYLTSGNKLVNIPSMCEILIICWKLFLEMSLCEVPTGCSCLFMLNSFSICVKSYRFVMVFVSQTILVPFFPGQRPRCLAINQRRWRDHADWAGGVTGCSWNPFVQDLFWS